jgi:cytochrome c-type biogenesis protein CcmH/NrfG
MKLYLGRNFRSIGQVSKAVTSLTTICAVSVSSSGHYQANLQHQQHLSFMAVHKTKAERVSKEIRKKLLAAHLAMFSITHTLQYGS